MTQQAAVPQNTSASAVTFDTPMVLAWCPEYKAYAFTHPMVDTLLIDVVPHMVRFGEQMKLLFKSQGEAQAWKRMCGDINSVAQAKAAVEFAVVAEASEHHWDLLSPEIGGN
jgi:hypothetical protein